MKLNLIFTVSTLFYLVEGAPLRGLRRGGGRNGGNKMRGMGAMGGGGNMNGEGDMNGEGGGGNQACVFTDDVSLSDDEENTINWMRLEENLARDVYIFYDDEYGLPFSNINNSEQTHMDKMEEVITNYDLEDPLDGYEDPGVFPNVVDDVSDKSLAELYDDLTNASSKAEACAKGVEIEERDIADLEDAIANTENEYLECIYNKLLSASNRHLQAFSNCD